MTSAVDDARQLLASRLDGTWDDQYLMTDDNEVHVVLHAIDGGLQLSDLEVGQPGTGLGGRVIDTLRQLADERRLDLVCGPIVNREYADRHLSWMTETGVSVDGDPMLSYTPKTA